MPALTQIQFHPIRLIHLSQVHLAQGNKLEDLSHLTESELSQYFHFNIPKRRNEWLAGRIACKKAIRNVLHQDCPLDYFEILPSDGNPPRSQMGDISLSLSHSGGWAIALATRLSHAGIDIEKKTVWKSEINEIAFSQSEINSIGNCNDRFFQFWTAKEAFLKAIGKGLTVDLRELQVRDYENDSVPTQCFILDYKNDSTLIQSSTLIDSYIYSWCTF